MINTLDFMSTLKLYMENQEDFNHFWHYLKLLNDANLIECIGDNNGDLGISFAASGEPIVSIKNFRLTLQGSQSLEAMKNNGFRVKVMKSLQAC